MTPIMLIVDYKHFVVYTWYFRNEYFWERVNFYTSKCIM